MRMPTLLLLLLPITADNTATASAKIWIRMMMLMMMMMMLLKTASITIVIITTIIIIILVLVVAGVLVLPNSRSPASRWRYVSSSRHIALKSILGSGFGFGARGRSLSEWGILTELAMHGAAHGLEMSKLKLSKVLWQVLLCIHVMSGMGLRVGPGSLKLRIGLPLKGLVWSARCEQRLRLDGCDATFFGSLTPHAFHMLLENCSISFRPRGWPRCPTSPPTQGM